MIEKGAQTQLPMIIIDLMLLIINTFVKVKNIFVYTVII